jgi:EAL domain-containing protein (putative c-di-GMP-specific phosphodiesterase class I)
MRAELLRARGLERRLSKALERDEITLHYEPIVSLLDRKPIAYEALARWRCDGEMIPPDAWIPVAETTGHLIDIGRHLAGLATSQLMAWHAAGIPASVSLNVSARQLRTPDLTDALDVALADGLDPRHLWLEVTEGIAVDDDALRALNALRDRGFRIALDDFGTGYSSLHAIGRLPIDIVKIDRSFIAGLSQAHALIAAVVSIAEAHGLEVVAEGVETEEQASRLTALGCRWGQGYLFGRAAPASSYVG